MKKTRIVGGVILIVFLLICSMSFSGAVKPSFFLINKSNQQQNTSFQEQTIDAKMLLKQLFFSRNTDRNGLRDLFTSTIKTKLNDIEQNNEITFGLTNDIDVDNNADTGVNGKDIRVQYLLLPYFLPSPELRLGLVFSVTIDRIGEEIKDEEFSVSASIANDQISVGYSAFDDATNEIPKRMQLSSTVFLQLSEGTSGFSFYMDPTYDSNEEGKQITLNAGINDGQVQRSYSFGFTPASETQITLQSTKESGKWNYTFTKDTPYNTVFTAELTKTVAGTTEQTTLTIDSLPDKVSFTLALTPFTREGGSIEYQSNTMYDISVLVETETIGLCKYALIKNTPRSLSAHWIPSRENGFFHVDLDSDGTTMYLLNTLQTPTINISIQDLQSVDMDAFWNLTNAGDLNIVKDPLLHVDLDVIFDEWEIQLDAEPTAKNIYFSWESNISGFLTLDTQQQPVSDIDMLVKGPSNGISINGETLSADDFHLEWTVWPLSDFYVNKTGFIDFITISIDVYVNGEWYHLWPLF